MISLETVLTVQQCEQLAIPTAAREHKIVVFIAATAAEIEQIKQENQYLATEVIYQTPPFSPQVAMILGLTTRGVIIVDRNFKVRQADGDINQAKVSQNLQQLISACGCDLSDQW